MKVRDVVAMLLRDDWRLVRIRGSHHHYKHPTKPGVVTVPGTGNDDLSPGTVRSIYKQAGLEWLGRSKGGTA
jgi:predicted RNA binding protein YcfA (HicA-like mRNA interferase family)